MDEKIKKINYLMGILIGPILFSFHITHCAWTFSTLENIELRTK